MLRFRRPHTPKGFDDHVAAARKHIADLVDKDLRPTKDDFKDRWGKFKPLFIAAQYRKCAFCESSVTNVVPGDVEHYRPKAGITRLPADRTRWGRERPDSGNREGRHAEVVSEWGYHFLAYEWNNYLFACDRCNRAWKGNLFPLAGPVTCERPTPESLAGEVPLLLNPYEGDDPTQHLMFLRDSKGNALFGQIGPREIAPEVESPLGRATIDTCHLDRPGLADARREKADQLAALLKELDELDGYEDPPHDRVERVLTALEALGAAENVFAGLVRGTYEDWAKHPWEEAFPSSRIDPPADLLMEHP